MTLKKSLDQLANEKRKLDECTANPKGNKEFIFSEYEGTYVNFNIAIGNQPNVLSEEHNPKGVPIIDEAFRLYLECEYSNEDEGFRSRVFKQMKQKSQNASIQFVWDASNWRIGAEPIYDDGFDVKGFTISFFHNFEGYPQRNGIFDDAKSQLNYRKLINATEIFLAEKGIDYEIKTKHD